MKIIKDRINNKKPITIHILGEERMGMGMGNIPRNFIVPNYIST